MKLIRIFLVVLLFGLSNSFQVSAKESTSIQTNNTLTYSWQANFEAVNYIVEAKNQNTLSTYNQETTNTSTTFIGLPNGAYEITVIGIKANSSTFIVIEDQTEL